MSKNIIFFLFIVILTANKTFASTYITEEGANEGLRRGAIEPFTVSTGMIIAHTNDDEVVRFNGVLIHPSLILTNRHTMTGKYNLSVGSFWAVDDAGTAREDLNNLETTQDRRTYLQQFASKLDLKTIFFHPDESVDLAIVKLNRPLNRVKRLPLLLDKPKSWENGYFVSYAPIYALSNLDKELDQEKRHIAILTVKEENLILSKSEVPILTTNWELEGDPTAPLNKNFISQPNMHRLTAFSQPSDSGAGFIIRKGNDYYVAGIHKGRAVFTNNEGTQEVKTLIIPVYPYKNWINEICNNKV